MPVLNLGVVDLPYNEAPPPGRRGRRKKKVTGGTQTTGDVARWLEDRYHVMEVFAELHLEDAIVPAIENSLHGTIESLLMGAPVTIDAYGGAMSAIEDRFRKFIDAKEMDSLGYPGVPTQASIKGIRRRFKNRLDPDRPSFQDTGLYETAFKAWME
jgi:hypothetical protein